MAIVADWQSFFFLPGGLHLGRIWKEEHRKETETRRQQGHALSLSLARPRSPPRTHCRLSSRPRFESVPAACPGSHLLCSSLTPRSPPLPACRRWRGGHRVIRTHSPWERVKQVVRVWHVSRPPDLRAMHAPPALSSYALGHRVLLSLDGSWPVIASIRLLPRLLLASRNRTRPVCTSKPRISPA